jgi:hypothetical protein
MLPAGRQADMASPSCVDFIYFVKEVHKDQISHILHPYRGKQINFIEASGRDQITDNYLCKLHRKCRNLNVVLVLPIK